MRTLLIWLTAVLLIGFIGIGPSYAQEGVNLLPNGGFETGNAGPWNIYGDVTFEVVTECVDASVPEGPIERDYCLHIVVPAAGAGPHESGMSDGSYIFEKGKKYTFSCFFKCKSGTLQFRMKPEHAADPWEAYGDQVFTATEKWQEFSVTTPVFTEDVTPASPSFHLAFEAGDFWIDGVRLYEGDYVPPLFKSFTAKNPSPEDGAVHEDTWASLSWDPGISAVTHDVYFGDNFDDVNNGAESTFQGNQAEEFYVVGFPGFPYPDGLVPGTTYYWRINEVNDTDPNSPWKGDVWSFSIPPKTAYFPNPVDGAESVDVNVQLSWTGGYGAKLHTIYFGDKFDDVNNATGGQAQGTTTYAPGALEMAKTYYWRVDEFDVVGTHKGDVWRFITEGAVVSPQPANGAVDVTQTPVISWLPGVFGASHEIYFGTDKDAVKNADTSSPEYKGSGNLGSESYEPGQLEWNTSYYWRIDEANNANAESPWTGPLWSFTTANFLIIDDFESYNDLDPDDPESNRIFNAWIDGYDNPTNGSLVGYDTPPFAEHTIVHSGNQSIPLFYDNSVGYSEATLTLTYPRDWTEKGVNKLTIWFRGISDNAAETLYVALNGSAVVNHDNPNATQINRWTEWNIDLQAFADQGMNLTNVDTISLGLGNKNNPVAGGSGMMYFDDIRLYAPKPETP